MRLARRRRTSRSAPTATSGDAGRRGDAGRESRHQRREGRTPHRRGSASARPVGRRRTWRRGETYETAAGQRSGVSSGASEPNAPCGRRSASVWRTSFAGLRSATRSAARPARRAAALLGLTKTAGGDGARRRPRDQAVTGRRAGARAPRRTTPFAVSSTLAPRTSAPCVSSELSHGGGGRAVDVVMVAVRRCREPSVPVSPVDPCRP